MLTASDYKRIRVMRMEGIRPSLIAHEFECGREHIHRITRDLDAPSCKGKPRRLSPEQEVRLLRASNDGVPACLLADRFGFVSANAVRMNLKRLRRSGSSVTTPPASTGGFSAQLCGTPLAYAPKAVFRPGNAR